MIRCYNKHWRKTHCARRVHLLAIKVVFLVPWCRWRCVKFTLSVCQARARINIAAYADRIDKPKANSRVRIPCSRSESCLLDQLAQEWRCRLCDDVKWFFCMFIKILDWARNSLWCWCGAMPSFLGLCWMLSLAKLKSATAETVSGVQQKTAPRDEKTLG